MKVRGVVISITAAIIGLCCIAPSIFGEELSVEFLLDPDIRTIDLVAPQQVTIVARPSKDDVTYRWQLNGLGELQGNEGDAGQIYLPPHNMEGDMTQAIISVVVTDKLGNTAKASVTFTLKQPQMPTPTATPTETPAPTATATEIPEPTATPTVMPSPTATVTNIPKPTAPPTKIPTIRPTNIPKPTATPDLPIEERLNAIGARLAQLIKRYEQLKKEEEKGNAVGKDVVNVLTELVATLKEIEDVYVRSERTEMLEKIPDVRRIREQFANELSRRKK
ncbi:probable ATP-dependent RNA helicase DDX59-like [Candidatus Moduliflexus flocculans]|uniref:Probable ATP-dependent RNA helicase DDX59-like n=1 Tax=Candidatus Moduliflexus flocculans TaxID=1499966 RepID=A0A0S6VW26_9BACT|nr:probable ATP-dependent RNA helicase DDX59-like [Candidatus Moduliflexus flocculans]